jgi:hypothetical protein
MEPNQSEHLYTVRFDEQQEAWYVHTGTGRLPLSRLLLQHLVTQYNSIHRASSLTLIDRQAMEELGCERRDFADPAPPLHDRIAAESAGTAAPGRLTLACRRAVRLAQHLLRAVSRRR